MLLSAPQACIRAFHQQTALQHLQGESDTLLAPRELTAQQEEISLSSVRACLWGPEDRTGAEGTTEAVPYRLGLELRSLGLTASGFGKRGTGCSSVCSGSLELTEGSYSLGPVLWVFVSRVPEYPVTGWKCIHLYLCLSAPGTFFFLAFSFFHPPVTPPGIIGPILCLLHSQGWQSGLMITIVSFWLQFFSTLQHKPLLKIDPFPPRLPFLKSCFCIDFIPAASFQVNPSTVPLLTQFSLKENRSSSMLKKKLLILLSTENTLSPYCCLSGLWHNSWLLCILARALGTLWDSLVAQRVKSLPAVWGNLSLIPGSGWSPGEENGNPLQYSCLENPMDRGAWWAIAHRVSKSRTQLSDFTFTFSSLLGVLYQNLQVEDDKVTGCLGSCLAHLWPTALMVLHSTTNQSLLV